MSLKTMWATIRIALGVEPMDAPLSSLRRDTSSLEERDRIDARLTRQQAALADLLASASLDEQRSRSRYPDV